jgi:Cu2+-exporting ATPase
MQLIHQNTGIVAIPNLAALLLAVAIGIDPLSATLVNNGSTVIAGLNGLRPLLTDSEEFDQLTVSVDIDSPEQDSKSFPSVTLAELEQATNQVHTNGNHSLELKGKCTQDISTNSVDSEMMDASNSVKNHPVMNGLNGSHKVKIKREPLTAVALANRLNVSTTTISRRKSKPDFSEWARHHDPEGVPWAYSKQSRLFMVAG